MKRTKTVVVAGVTALALAGIGGGVAVAASSGSSTTPVALAAAGTPSTPTSGAPAPGAKAGAGAKHRAHRLLRRAEHAEATLRTKTGTQVVDLQRGAVTAVSPTSITVRSQDGFTAGYVVDSNTKVTKDKQKSAITGVATGNTVVVVGTKSGATTTARRIADPTK